MKGFGHVPNLTFPRHVRPMGRSVRPGSAKRAGAQWRSIMGAQYNWIIDNAGIRLALNVVAFCVWFGLAIAVLL